jgi:5-methylcytosine-specific restriction endonuclease McrA
MDWTEGRKRTFIVSTLRGGMRRWPPKWEALKDAFAGKMVNPNTKRLAYHYKCASCKNLFTTKDIQIDHIQPVVDPIKGFISYDDFIDRLFCQKDNLQVLCKPCHKIKTNEEKQKRKVK